MDTTRRSSRAARASQPLLSSASSNSSSRGDRATRSHNKSNSPRKSTPSNSLSSEPLDDTITAEDNSQSRRKRGRGEERQKSTKEQVEKVEVVNGGEEEGEDDEAVRCICGFDEYPGPPQVEEDNKHGIKDGIDEPIITVAGVTEDLAGFFLQCDMCKVWQHGGCVGIMNEDTSPDEYYCEECRKDLHKIFTATNGQRYSHYLPLYQSLSRTTSRAPSFPKDGTKSPRGGSKSGRPSSATQGAKRRSTMNSRDAAYDEEEQLRRAIEASKGEKGGGSIDGGARLGKRGRSDSEEKPEGPKRQRTASSSPSPQQEQNQSAILADSDEGEKAKAIVNKQIRGAAAKIHREKELREERERSRQDAANKRKGRAERRRAEDSDPSDDVPLAEKVAAKSAANKASEVTIQPLDPPLSSQPVPDTPPLANPPPISHKKGGRPPNARKGKLGRNQYTRDKELQELDDQSPHRSQSRDISRDDGHGSSHRGPNSESKLGKAKASPSSKISMADMERRVSAILDFISRTQLEMAGESTASSPAGSATDRMIRNLAESLPMVRVNGDGDEEAKEVEPGDPPPPPKKDFKDLSCVEMMDVLTRQLVKWQKEYM